MFEAAYRRVPEPRVQGRVKLRGGTLSHFVTSCLTVRPPICSSLPAGYKKCCTSFLNLFIKMHGFACISCSTTGTSTVFPINASINAVIYYRHYFLTTSPRQYKMFKNPFPIKMCIHFLSLVMGFFDNLR